MKRPGVAVLLNVFPLVLGLGYLYLGLWRRFAFTFGLQIILGFIVARGAPQATVGLTLLWIFTMLDAHRQAKVLNVGPPPPVGPQTGTSCTTPSSG